MCNIEGLGCTQQVLLTTIKAGNAAAATATWQPQCQEAFSSMAGLVLSRRSLISHRFQMAEASWGLKMDSDPFWVAGLGPGGPAGLPIVPASSHGHPSFSQVRVGCRRLPPSAPLCSVPNSALTLKLTS